ncbi:MAG: hypothetical protein U1E23_09415 [Reyranellaceae bacterium]
MSAAFAARIAEAQTPEQRERAQLQWAREWLRVTVEAGDNTGFAKVLLPVVEAHLAATEPKEPEKPATKTVERWHLQYVFHCIATQRDETACEVYRTREEAEEAKTCGGKGRLREVTGPHLYRVMSDE